MVLIFGASIYAFTRSDWHPARPEAELEPGNVPGSGMAVRTEALHLWLPEAFSELAKRDSSLPGARTRAELQRYLELRKREGLWYALTQRMYPANGRSTDITYIKRRLTIPEASPSSSTSSPNCPGIFPSTRPRTSRTSRFTSCQMCHRETTRVRSSPSCFAIIDPRWNGRDILRKVGIGVAQERDILCRRRLAQQPTAP